MKDIFIKKLIKEYQSFYANLTDEIKSQIVDVSVFEEAIEMVKISDDTDPRLVIYEAMLYEYRTYTRESGLMIADFFVQVATNAIKVFEDLFNQEIRSLKELDRLLDELETLLDRPLSTLEFTVDEWHLIKFNYHS